MSPPRGWIEAAQRAAWKNAVRDILDRTLGLGDVWNEDDPYDLAECWPAAFAAGQSPRAFVEEAFAEDYADREYNDYLAAEAAASEDG